VYVCPIFKQSLGDAPMSPELAEELAEWQSLGAESWEMFPYEEDGEPS
jgi:hypothetical protein